MFISTYHYSIVSTCQVCKVFQDLDWIPSGRFNPQDHPIWLIYRIPPSFVSANSIAASGAQVHKEQKESQGDDKVFYGQTRVPSTSICH